MHSLLTRTLLTLVAIATTGTLFITPASQGSTSEQTLYTPARTMAALGDSITQAANTCREWDNCPEGSWATGTSSYNVKSQAERLQNMQPTDRDIKTYNNAQSFTKVADLPRQATLAVTQKAEYVTILSGSNDACGETIQGMTNVNEFRTHVQETLSILSEKLPLSKIFIASIPNIQQLWVLNRDNEQVIEKWREGNICQNMLNPDPTTLQERQKQVSDRIDAYNQIWEEECSTTPNCMWDGGAIHEHEFTIEELSATDSFHPSLEGQNMLAKLTWNSVPNGFFLIERGTPRGNTEGEVPVVKVLSPENHTNVYGIYDIRVFVKASKPLEAVYLETSIGSFDLYPLEGNIWKVTVDTTMVPDGVTATFRAVATDKKGSTGVSKHVSATVDNSELLPCDVLREADTRVVSDGKQPTPEEDKLTDEPGFVNGVACIPSHEESGFSVDALKNFAK